MGFLVLLITSIIIGSGGAIYAYFYVKRTFYKNWKPTCVAFFHPYTNDGGGGERVLWCAVRAVQEEAPKAEVVIYSGDKATPESLEIRAKEKFGVSLLRPIEVVLLDKRPFVDAATYPVFTLIGQSIGSLVLAWEALQKLTPGVFVDTAGYAFSYPLARLLGCRVACYTHYPTISTDMLSRVQTRQTTYNNSGVIAQSRVLSAGKMLYYRVVAWLYGWAGRRANVVVVNSGWTEAHIQQLWSCPARITRVYPPCDTSSLQSLPLERPEGEERYIISLAQFRPEKAHALQLHAFALALEGQQESSSEQLLAPGGPKLPGGSRKTGGVRLKMVGSCRHREDEQRIELLSNLAVQLGIDSRVDFCVNVTFEELKKLLGGAVAGLHTMTDEHFGIGVVEYMAAGAIPIAHNSGGPKEDIVLEEDGIPTGFLAKTRNEYAAAILHVLDLSEHERVQIATACRRRAAQFSEDKFDKGFKAAIRPLLEPLM